MAGYVYKPQTRKGPVFLTPTAGSEPPKIRLADGRVITARRGDQAGGVFQGHEGYQYVFDNDVLGQKGATLIFNGQEQAIGDSNMSYRGDSFGQLSESSKGSIGDMSGMGAAPGGMMPGQVGSAFYPGYLGGMFPTAQTVNYSNIQTAPYNFTDPQKFAAKYGAFNRQEYAKNFAQAKQFSLDTLDTELQSLKDYVPAASALKRQETSIDNIFNQQQRMEQARAALPGVEQQLAAQSRRADAYAAGRLPSEQEDRALELGVRSQSADQSTAGGFGASSSVARKASDLMSAQQRLQLSQYGDQLLGQNISTKAQLFMAPTSYSDAGQQVRVTPSVSASQLTSQNLSDLNAYSMVSATNALQSNVQQQQFKTSNEQNTRQFNASMGMQAQQFNANAVNQFAMDKFNYDVSYAGSVAGAYQTDMNTQMALEQQQIARQEANAAKKETQQANTINSVISSAGTVAGAAVPIIQSIIKGDAKPGTTDSSTGGVVQPDGSVLFPDGTTVDRNGTVSDSNGNTLGTVDSSGNFTQDPNVDTPSNPTTDPLGTPYPEGTGGGYPEATIVESPSTTGTPTSTDPTVAEPPPSDTTTVDPYPTTDPLGTEYSSTKAMTTSQAASRMYSPVAKSFATDLNINAEAATALAASGTKKYEFAADAVLANAGIYTKKVDGAVEIGVDFNGKPVYADAELQGNNDITYGTKPVSQIQELITPFNVKDLNSSKLENVSKTASNPELISQLDNAAANRNTKSFVNTIQTAYGNARTDSPKLKDSAGTAIASYKLAQSWGKLSGAQKSLALATIGLQSIKSSKGESLGNTPIDYTASKNYAPMKIGDALEIAKTGANVYAVANSWQDFAAVAKMEGIKNDPAAMVKLGREYGFIE